MSVLDNMAIALGIARRGAGAVWRPLRTRRAARGRRGDPRALPDRGLPRRAGEHAARRACASCSTSPWRSPPSRASCCSTSRPAASASRRSTTIMEVVVGALQGGGAHRPVRRARHGHRRALRRPGARVLRRHGDRRRAAGRGAARREGQAVRGRRDPAPHEPARARQSPMLRVSGLDARIGPVPILHDVELCSRRARCAA